MADGDPLAQEQNAADAIATISVTKSLSETEKAKRLDIAATNLRAAVQSGDPDATVLCRYAFGRHALLEQSVEWHSRGVGSLRSIKRPRPGRLRSRTFPQLSSCTEQSRRREAMRRLLARRPLSHCARHSPRVPCYSSVTRLGNTGSGPHISFNFGRSEKAHGPSQGACELERRCG